MPRKAYDTPAVVDAIDGDVSINGPGRIAGSITPEAAVETSRRLRAFAEKALGQRAGDTKKDEGQSQD